MQSELITQIFFRFRLTTLQQQYALKSKSLENNWIGPKIISTLRSCRHHAKCIRIIALSIEKATCLQNHHDYSSHEM